MPINGINAFFPACFLPINNLILFLFHFTPLFFIFLPPARTETMLESPTHTTVMSNMPSNDIKSNIEHHQDKPVLGKYGQI